MSTTEACKRIRTALRNRSGRAWSVTRGRGTAMCWLYITAPPVRRDIRDDMSVTDQSRLIELLGLGAHVHDQGVSISPDQQAEYVRRAETGKAGT